MQSHWINDCLTYDGSQLRPLFAYMEQGVLGDSIIGWRGPCDIPKEKIVDGEDLRAQARICGSDMLHFIIELFDHKLHTAVALQRLLVSVAKDLVAELAVQSAGAGPALCLVRRGDDLYLGEKKFNISIASVSTVSAMIHIAFNIETAGTPVPTLGLSDLSVDPLEFAKRFLQLACQEIEEVQRATKKVRPLV